jgi:hypothetical protein
MKKHFEKATESFEFTTLNTNTEEKRYWNLFQKA